MINGSNGKAITILLVVCLVALVVARSVMAAMHSADAAQSFDSTITLLMDLIVGAFGVMPIKPPPGD